jgi:hypothetical protein
MQKIIRGRGIPARYQIGEFGVRRYVLEVIVEAKDAAAGRIVSAESNVAVANRCNPQGGSGVIFREG